MRFFKVALPLALVVLLLGSCQNADLLENEVTPSTENATLEAQLKGCSAFSATFNSTIISQAPGSRYCGAGQIHTRQGGPGKSRTMGTASLFINSCIVPPVPGVSPPRIINGEFVLTDQNGDQLELFVAETIPNPPTFTTGGGDYVVTGGTGRYAGATGRGTGTYVVTGPGVNTVNINGTLCLPSTRTRVK